MQLTGELQFMREAGFNGTVPQACTTWGELSIVNSKVGWSSRNHAVESS